MRRWVMVLSLAAALAPAAACAHARLVSSSGDRRGVVLRFSEGVIGAMSGADVTGPGGPTPVRMRVGADGRSLEFAAARPLAPGAYRVAYHVVSADTHRVAAVAVVRVR